MRQQATYENIKPLVANVHQQGSRLTVTFTCPVTGHTAESSSMMRANRHSMGNVVRRSLIQNLTWSLRRWVYQFLGRGMAGRIAGDVASQAARSAGNNLQFSQGDKNKAVVDAFQNVKHDFVWDEQTDHWVHKSAQELV